MMAPAELKGVGASNAWASIRQLMTQSLRNHHVIMMHVKLLSRACPCSEAATPGTPKHDKPAPGRSGSPAPRSDARPPSAAGSERLKQQRQLVAR